MRCGQRLAKHGLPPHYVQRFAEELSDHLEDLKEENMSTEADAYSRLGQPEQVADAAVAAYRRRSFLGRHPAAAFLVFGVSPVVSLILLAAVCMTGVWGLDEACKGMGIDTEQSLRSLKRFDPTASITPYFLSLLVVVIPSIAASILYGKLARRLALGRKWIVVSCVVLAVVALMPICSARFSDVPGQSRLAVGYWSPLHIEYLWGNIVHSLCTPRQLFQFLIPLAVGCWFVRRKGDEIRLSSAS